MIIKLNVNLSRFVKKLYLLFFSSLFTLVTSAQTGYNFYRYGLGFGADVGFVRATTNLQKQYSHPAFGVDLYYSFNPYWHLATELQAGTFSGGGPGISLDPNGRSYTNHYTAAIIHMDLQVGSMVDYQENRLLNFLKDFYLKDGIGILFNNNIVQRTNIIPSQGSLDSVFPGKDNSINLIVPVGIGYEAKLYNKYDEPSWAFDLAYTHYFVFGEGIDGYEDPSSRYGTRTNFHYVQISVGFKYYFLGRIHSYKKAIKGFYKNK